MATELGRVEAAGNALVPIRLAAGETIECLLDTGFTGELVLPRTLVERLQLAITGVQECIVAGGGVLPAFTTLVEMNWLGVQRMARVIISEGDDLLLGTVLLEGTLLTIDYINYTVEIRKP
jgi:clan AA aspartic protease